MDNLASLLEAAFYSKEHLIVSQMYSRYLVT